MAHLPSPSSLRHKQNIRIFAISVLESKNERLAKLSKERREQLADQLEPLKIKYEMFPGVDGYGLTKEEEKLRQEGDRSRKKFLKETMTCPEFACALSHIRVYEKIIRENIEEALILEDDCTFREDFFSILFQRHLWAPKNWQFLHFQFHENDPVSHIKLYYVDASKKYRCMAYPSFFYYAGTYTIRLSTAKTLVNMSYPVRWTSDQLFSRFGKHRPYVYGVDKPLVYNPMMPQKSTLATAKPAALYPRHFIRALRWMLRPRTRLHYCILFIYYTFYKIYWKIFPPKSIALDK